MKKLSDNWFTEGIIDLEYQQYILLDYLQAAKKQYNEYRIYPYLSDLIRHHKNLVKFQENKNTLFNSFPKKLTGINITEGRLEYENTEKDSLSDVSEIVEFALPEFKKHIEIGQALYDAIDKQLIVEPIGIQPLYKKEGYIMVNVGKSIKVFQFIISSLEINEEKFVGVNFTHLAKYDANMINLSQKNKLKILEKSKDIPNACSYFVNIHNDFSNVLEESIIPILKRKIIIV